MYLEKHEDRTQLCGTLYLTHLSRHHGMGHRFRAWPGRDGVTLTRAPTRLDWTRRASYFQLWLCKPSLPLPRRLGLYPSYITYSSSAHAHGMRPLTSWP